MPRCRKANGRGSRLPLCRSGFRTPVSDADFIRTEDKTIIIVSDLDDTLLGDNTGLARFADWVAERRDRIKLVYATGRYFESIVDLVETTTLPAPDVAISDIGTEIRLFRSGKIITEWHRGFPRDWDAEAIRNRLLELPFIRLQDPLWQSDYKASFYLEDAGSDQIDAVYEALWSIGVSPHVIYSMDRYLDVLPPRANKGTAAAFLAGKWNVPHRCVVASGDSGNDLAMMIQGFRCTIVGNAEASLKKLNGSSIYHARRPRALGVLEGLEHWLANDRVLAAYEESDLPNIVLSR